jgi:acetyl/propionyl-CoA carboxylase alpha subunit
MAAAPHPIRRVLVANRGEIARRLIKGAHDAGCEAVAVYAADDAASPHVGEADAAVLLAGSTLAETYLSPAALVHAAQAAGADALHPGYGFLSENPALPEACGRAGVVWVGPPPEAMRVMGHKARAKEVVAEAGVPVLPSAVVAPRAKPEELAVAGERVDYPLLVKASAGGGGRGMRLVHGPGELADAVASAQRESAAAFGSDEVFLERYLAAPRHVEVQVFGDTQGTVLHLYDRECSVQRRHQKVVEEAPAVLVPEATRRLMWDAAVAAARAVGYVGAGTVEYLVDASGFYFLEMNTRLQVEHGVTELVTGLDLVGLQLAVASGRPLPFGQADISATGHAVEVRLCAERPREDYRPTPGTVTHVSWPEGPGLRTDRAIESGSVVSPAYDSLVAKLMAHGEDREAAIAKLSMALRALELDGLETNRDLLAAVLDDDAFGRGEADIHYLEHRPDLRDALLPDTVRRRHGAAVAFCLTDERAVRQPGPGARGGVAQCRPRPPCRRADRRRRHHGGARGRTRRASPRARRWRVAGRGHGHHPWRRRRPRGGGRAAAALSGTPHCARRADVNGPEGQSGFVPCSDRGRSRRARRHRRRVPGPAAWRRDQGPRRPRRHRDRGRGAGGARGDEDGAHPARRTAPGRWRGVQCAPGQQVDVQRPPGRRGAGVTALPPAGRRTSCAIGELQRLLR